MLIVAGAFVFADTAALAAPGELDSSFSGDGRVTTRFGKSASVGEAVAIQPDGKIVVAGTLGSTTSSDFLVGRYNSNGRLDATFGGDGKVHTPDGKSGFCVGSAVAVEPDGRIVAVGIPEITLVRYLGD
jgi:uncharacterized delta-60 repeat protein